MLVGGLYHRRGRGGVALRDRWSGQR